MIEYNEWLSEPIEIAKQNWDSNIKPLVAIQLLTYNHVNFITECIEGMLMQKTTFRVRILVFDDCSNDGTTEIILSYAQKYPQLFELYIQPENTYGKPTIRKPAIEKWYNEAAKLKYIAKCEGDDYWTDPNKLQRQVDFLENNLSVVIHTENGLIKYLENGNEKVFNTNLEPTYYSAIDLLEKRKFPTASVMFRSHAIKEMFNNNISGDTPLWIFLSTKGKVFYNGIISSVYNVGKQGVVKSTQSYKWAKMMERWNLDMQEILKDNELDFVFRERNYLEFYQAYRTSENLKFKILALISCFRYNNKKAYFLVKSEIKILLNRFKLT